MNISTGGPHILFFERDQQLNALMTSEFQLAGYECHAARTAVEVFDTIARFPVRILLVNLAQAAAGRREFWVALDTQRRGRGVQVLTYFCSNLAGYGPRDTDENLQGQRADVEVDGMLGLINLVDVVRERVPGPTSSTPSSTQPRIPRATPITTQTPGTSSSSVQTNNPPNRTNPAVDGTRTITITASPSTQTAPAAQQTYSDKIRAVLYPTQRSVTTPSPVLDTNTEQATLENEQTAPLRYDDQQTVTQTEPQYIQPIQPIQPAQTIQGQQTDASSTMLQRLANGQLTSSTESGLDQLSRLLQERNLSNSASAAPNQIPNDMVQNQSSAPTLTEPQKRPVPNYMTVSSVSQASSSNDEIGTQPLRASPIEDLPLDRATGGNGTNDSARRTENLSRTGYGSYGTNSSQNTTSTVTAQTTPLASISTLRNTNATTPVTPPIAKVTLPMPVVLPPSQGIEDQPVQQYVQEQKPVSSISSVSSVPGAQPLQTVENETGVPDVRDVPSALSKPVYDISDKVPNVRKEALPHMEQQVEDEEQEEEEDEEVNTSTTTVPQDAPQVQDNQENQENQEKQAIFDEETIANNANDATLMEIVHSFPPTQAPVSPPKTVSGRTMRPLGNILLEGHLVPQSRLEVVQGIQRMLRGVDMNYQLGEILLMFKLLTPDQLLAANLVSYGMVSTQQISALGRIRQELHAVGLEYDLESLLILFRMLTPEQLREVRASWQG